MFGNLLKAVVAVAVTPVTLVADAVMLIPDACDNHRSKDQPFSRTTNMLKSANDNLKEAVK